MGIIIMVSSGSLNAVEICKNILSPSFHKTAPMLLFENATINREVLPSDYPVS